MTSCWTVTHPPIACAMLGFTYLDKPFPLTPSVPFFLPFFLPAENWLFAGARQLFMEPDVTPGEEFDFKWEKPDVEGMIFFFFRHSGDY